MHIIKSYYSLEPGSLLASFPGGRNDLVFIRVYVCDGRMMHGHGTLLITRPLGSSQYDA